MAFAGSVTSRRACRTQSRSSGIRGLQTTSAVYSNALGAHRTVRRACPRATKQAKRSRSATQSLRKFSSPRKRNDDEPTDRDREKRLAHQTADMKKRGLLFSSQAGCVEYPDRDPQRNT